MDAEGQVQSTVGPEHCPGEEERGHRGTWAVVVTMGN